MRRGFSTHGPSAASGERRQRGPDTTGCMIDDDGRAKPSSIVPVLHSPLDMKPRSPCAASPTRTRSSGAHASCWCDGLHLCSHPSDSFAGLWRRPVLVICNLSSTASLLMKRFKHFPQFLPLRRFSLERLAHE